MTFWDMISAKAVDGKHLCVGLDPSEAVLPPTEDKSQGLEIRVSKFCEAIIRGTKDVAACFKLNAGFYESLHHDGLAILRRTISYAQSFGVPAILDNKSGDVGDSSKKYAEKAFDMLHADAVTVSPYPGDEDGIQPFLDRKEKGVIVLCRMSNKGSARTQDRLTDVSLSELEEFFPHGYREIGNACKWVTTMRHILMPYHQFVALEVSRRWNKNGNCGLVVGATAPEQLRLVRALTDLPILSPGIGKQKGDLEKTVQYGLGNGGRGLLANASTSIAKAWSLQSVSEINVELSARAEAERIHNEIVKCRQAAQGVSHVESGN